MTPFKGTPLTITSLAACLALALGNPSDASQENFSARKLYEKMTRTLLEARSLRVTSQVRMSATPKKLDWLFLRQGNRVRIESGAPAISVLHWVMLSDGSTIYEPQSAPWFRPAPAELGARWVHWFVRFGARPMFNPPQCLPENAKLETSEFRLGEITKVGKVTTQELRFKLGWTGTKDGFNVKVWIDRKTHLPVKRHVSATFKVMLPLSREIIQEWEEVYTRIELEAKIDPARFKVPE